jgi:hypothetical protein
MMGRRHKGWGKLRKYSGKPHEHHRTFQVWLCGPHVISIPLFHAVAVPEKVERKLCRFRRYARMAMRKRGEL